MIDVSNRVWELLDPLIVHYFSFANTGEMTTILFPFHIFSINFVKLNNTLYKQSGIKIHYTKQFVIKCTLYKNLEI